MPLILPYQGSPGYSGTYSDFTATTVHSYTAHNTPHQGLLSNDVYLKDQIDATNTAIAEAAAIGTLVRVAPVEIYRIGNTVSTSATIPSEYRFSAAANVAFVNTWVVHSYPSVAIVPASASAIFLKCVSYTGSSGEAYIRLRSTGFPDDIIVFSYSPYNSDDGASDTSIIEAPYYASRTFESYCSGNTNYHMMIFVVGYRS